MVWPPTTRKIKGEREGTKSAESLEAERVPSVVYWKGNWIKWPKIWYIYLRLETPANDEFEFYKNLPVIEARCYYCTILLC